MKKITTALCTILAFAGLLQAQNLPKFSGLMFGDYYYNVQFHDQTQKDVNAFEYRRIYLTADYTIADGIWSRFRLESDPTASNLSNNKLSTMVKDAFLDFKNVGDGDIVLGLQGTWNINMSEGIFGYRSLEKTIQDLHGISSSRDLGVSITQKFSDEISSGFLLGNNTGNNGTLFGQTNSSQARFKSAYLFFQIKPVNELTILLDGQYAGAPSNKYMKTCDLIVNYANSNFGIGVQGFLNSIDHGESNGSTLKRNGISFNGWFALIDKLRLVGRYDSYDPNTTNRSSLANSSQTLIIGALDWAIRKNVHIMPNIEYTHYAFANTKDDVVARVTYFFSF